MSRAARRMASTLFEIIRKNTWIRYVEIYEAIVPFSSCHAKWQVLSFKYGCWKVLYKSNKSCGKTRNVCRDRKKRKLSFALILFSFVTIFSYVMCHSTSCCDPWENDVRKMLIFSTARKGPWVALIWLRDLKINTNLISVSKLVWNRTFALFDEYYQSSRFVPTIFNEKLLQNVSICYKLYAHNPLVHNKNIFISCGLTCFTSRIKPKVAVSKGGSDTTSRPRLAP